jgi:hypothetical protein
MTRLEATRKPDWPICATNGCIGVRCDGHELCLAHLGSETRETILAALKPGADLDLRGTPIDGELLSQLLAALRPEDGLPTLGDAQFDGAQFTGDAQFNRVQFTGEAKFIQVRFSGTAGFFGTQFGGIAWFDGAAFGEDAWFIGAQFSGDAGFTGAQFGGTAWFDGAAFNLSADAEFDGFTGTHFSRTAGFTRAQFTGEAKFTQVQFSGDAKFDGAEFSGDAEFERAQFSRDAGFEGTQFSGTAWFEGTQFGGNVWFFGAQFSQWAWFGGVEVSGDAGFTGAQFSGDAGFEGAQFNGDTGFIRAQFKQAGTFGPVLAGSLLMLDRATFEQNITIEAIGAKLSCAGTRFAEPATLRLRHTEVVLDGAVFAKPSILAFASVPFKHYDRRAGVLDALGEGWVTRVKGDRSPGPRLLSLRGVDAATLTLSELDLAACLFQGALHLDQLRIEGARPFADTPAAWKLHLGRRSIPVWRRWSRRQTLAEEHQWRGEPSSPPRPSRRLGLIRPTWHSPACQTPQWVAERTGQRVQQLTPDRLALLYRALRKAQEDSKNEPGAADFYYGEMEMRRHDEHTPWPERVILWLYWLVSGYGLRGLRALTCLVAVVVGLAALLQAIGFNGGDPSFRDALIYAAQSIISIAGGNEALTEHVSWAGEVLRIVLRLVGPILLGLALLSIRNRVKR